MFGNDDDYGRPRPINWGRSAVVLVLVLGLAVILMLLVATADFGDKSPSTTVPKTPGQCAPFCPTNAR
ncbi:hypothetical protein [Nocardia sp. CA-119907]|uniref:hypothetical protein n=1 Tax=Nocardia sp. CA-119907 TaxID=3239973 RepID=UPI003D977E47